MSRVFSGSANNFLSYAGSMGISDRPVTILVWVKFSSVSVGGNICQYENTSAANLTHKIQSTGNLRFQGSQQYGSWGQTSSAASVDTWYPLVGVYKTDGSVYENALGGVTSGFIGTFVAESSPRFSIGSPSYNVAVAPLTGKVAHVAIWSSALSSGDIASLQAGANPSTISSVTLLAYWALTDSSLTDSIGGKVLSLTGTATVDTGDNPSVAGASDTTAPNFTSGPTATTVGSTTATVSATINDASGSATISYLVNPSTHTDGDFDASSFAVVATSGSNANVSLTGLTAGALNTIWYQAKDTAGNRSTAASITILTSHTGYTRVTAATPNSTSAYRITSTADIASGDIIDYKLTQGSGTVSLNTDGSFDISSGVQQFDFYVGNSTDGWGAHGVWTITSGSSSGRSSFAKFHRFSFWG